MSEHLSRFTLYESRRGFWIVGQTVCGSTFRVLHLQPEPDSNNLRFAPQELGGTFSKHEIEQWIQTQKQNARIDGEDEFRQRAPAAWGLLGLIRFTSCYYLCMVTKCSVVAVLGSSKIYHIDETKLVPLVHSARYEVPDRRSVEARLASTFHSLDLAKTFYFSPTYDLTNTLQMNMSGVSDAETAPMFVWNSHLLTPLAPSFGAAAKMNVHVRKTWFIEIIHGFIDQARISVFGNSLYITLIARRSHQFAGARFYKRGVNIQGYPANEVETEQIVSNQLHSQLSDRYTSYVQHRGSICVSWSQMSNNMSPQPPIRIDAVDPYYEAAAKHFNRMFSRYGYPVRVLNLVKTREKRARESLLSNEFEACIRYLNQFLPQKRADIDERVETRSKGLDLRTSASVGAATSAGAGASTSGSTGNSVSPSGNGTSNTSASKNSVNKNSVNKNSVNTKSGTSIGTSTAGGSKHGLSLEGGVIEYTHWDMSRAAKSRSSEVMDYLGKYAKMTLEATSIYQVGKSMQRGVCRTNCIDCLDRTNAAQSVIAKYALGYQLHALGIIDRPRIDYDTDVIDLLTEMYHDHGDTLALQYGGSNLVNTVETYRRINQWRSHSRDLIESIRRFYSNSFMDAQRQDAINVFLGNYQYTEGTNLWDLSTDYYLHNSVADNNKRSYRQWYEPKYLLPQRCEDRGGLELRRRRRGRAVRVLGEDWYNFTSLSQLFFAQINSTDKYSKQLSPFEIHLKPKKRTKESKTSQKEKKSVKTKEESILPQIDQLELLYSRYFQYSGSGLLQDDEDTATLVSSSDYTSEYSHYFDGLVEPTADYALPNAEWGVDNLDSWTDGFYSGHLQDKKASKNMSAPNVLAQVY